MKIFNSDIDIDDENEKLKWSYTIFSKSKDMEQTLDLKNGYTFLNEIGHTLNESVSISVEVVSSKMFKNDSAYYLKVCDQTETIERIILKVPTYFELPNLKFGDILDIKNAIVEDITWFRPKSVRYALRVDTNLTKVKTALN